MHCGFARFIKISTFFCGILFASLSVPAGAQRASSSVDKGVAFAYDATRETTLTGTIEQVIATRELGRPAGMHLMISGPQGMEDVCVGPFLNEQTRATLQAGVPLRVIGSTMQIHDKEYFLVREMKVGGDTITVRNQRGFLLNRVSHVKQTAASATKGDQQ